jgi:hypothetical protein
MSSATDASNNCKVSLKSLGLTCLGPSVLSGNFVVDRCPNEVTIDLDSAKLIPWNGTMRLDSRCAACRYCLGVKAWLSSHGIDVQHRNPFCTFHGCDQPNFAGSETCSRHVAKRLFKAHEAHASPNLRPFREAFELAARKTWTIPPQYRRVRSRIDDIMQGKRRGSDLVILDDEFSAGSRQLWEFAIIERVSGSVLINTLIDRPEGLKHKPMGHNPFMEWVSRKQAKRVFSSTRKLGDISCLDVYKVASKLQQAGITQDTMILVWHMSTSDLTLLRLFLESAGYVGILPPDENCIPLIQVLRTNLRDGPAGYGLFPMRLDLLFPIMYPRHSLIGLNHQALVDYQQTRLVCMAFDELCKPIEERGDKWRPETCEQSAQTSILDWLRDEHTVEGSNGETRGENILLRDGGMFVPAN